MGPSRKCASGEAGEGVHKEKKMPFQNEKVGQAAKETCSLAQSWSGKLGKKGVATGPNQGFVLKPFAKWKKN